MEFINGSVKMEKIWIWRADLFKMGMRQTTATQQTMAVLDFSTWQSYDRVFFLLFNNMDKKKYFYNYFFLTVKTITPLS